MAVEESSTEQWRPVVGYEGSYSVSDQGRVRSEERVVERKDGAHYPVRERILRPGKQRSGHHLVVLCRHGIQATTPVHRLVLEAFVGLRPEGMECRHLNGDPVDNRLENLAWGTHAENGEDMVEHGTSTRGDRHSNSKLTREAVRVICHLTASRRVPQSWLAKQFGINQATVSKINSGRAWGWATEDIRESTQHLTKKETMQCPL